MWRWKQRWSDVSTNQGMPHFGNDQESEERSGTDSSPVDLKKQNLLTPWFPMEQLRFSKLSSVWYLLALLILLLLYFWILYVLWILVLFQIHCWQRFSLILAGVFSFCCFLCCTDALYFLFLLESTELYSENHSCSNILKYFLYAFL